MAKSQGWTIEEDAGRGWRRTVASPRPKRIVETDVIRALLEAGTVVVAAGGGGIPVAIQADGTVVGVEAVVDKDLASGLLAHELGADMLLIPTAVPRVAIRFGTPQQRWLDSITVDEARAFLEAGEFGAGSMEPKVAAVADFVASTPGAVGVIGAAEEMQAIIEGTSGTRIVASESTAFLVAVNGTLMRGLKLNPNMTEAGATFVRETTTEPAYRLWAINDDYPAMIRVRDGSGVRIALEIWSVPRGGLAKIFLNEPPGLALGKVHLDDGSTVVGVLGESAVVKDQRARSQNTAAGGPILQRKQASHDERCFSPSLAADPARLLAVRLPGERGFRLSVRACRLPFQLEEGSPLGLQLADDGLFRYCRSCRHPHGASLARNRSAARSRALRVQFGTRRPRPGELLRADADAVALGARLRNRGRRDHRRHVEVGADPVSCRSVHSHVLGGVAACRDARAQGNRLRRAFPAMEVHWGESVIKALGSTLFVPAIASGIIFLVGIAISNWRHAIVAVMGAFIANALAAQAHATGGAINFGFMGFNGVLAALAAYVLVAADFRFAVLGSILATWLSSYVYREVQEVPVLASGFVLAIWAMLLLGWLNPRFAAKPPQPKAEPT